jgi:DNA-binding transcriptional regulator YiaG
MGTVFEHHQPAQPRTLSGPAIKTKGNMTDHVGGQHAGVTSSPTAVTQISREEVKQLATNVGVRQAARDLGIPEATVQAWSARGKWFKNPDKPLTVIQKQGATIATKTPSKVLQNTLQARHGRVRSNLSQFLVNASKVASKSRSPLQDASKVRDVASVMEKVWPESKDVQNVFSLNVLSLGGKVEVAAQLNTSEQ